MGREAARLAIVSVQTSAYVYQAIKERYESTQNRVLLFLSIVF